MQIEETAVEVAALIPRYSWELMDTEQRDVLMRDVVLPRWMVESSDGTRLGPKWWGETLGATVSSLENRVRRLQAKASDTDGKASVRLNMQRKARRLREAVKDPEVLELLSDVDKHELIERIRSSVTERPQRQLDERSGLDTVVSMMDMKDAVDRLERAEPSWSADVRDGRITPEIAAVALVRIHVIDQLMQDAMISDTFDASVPRP